MHESCYHNTVDKCKCDETFEVINHPDKQEGCRHIAGSSESEHVVDVFEEHTL
jgi:hypothetical protein